MESIVDLAAEKRGVAATWIGQGSATAKGVQSIPHPPDMLRGNLRDTDSRGVTWFGTRASGRFDSCYLDSPVEGGALLP